MLESQAKFEAERLSQQIYTISGDKRFPIVAASHSRSPGFIEYLEALVKSRLEKKERRKKARFEFKANEKRRKLEDVRLREEEKLQRTKGLSVVRKPVKREIIRDDKQESAPAAAAEDDDSKEEEKPIDPRNIHGGSVTADKLIRSKMVPGDRM